MSRLVHYCLFSKARGENATVVARKIFCYSPLPFDIKKDIYFKNLVHLLKINTEVGFQLINLLSKKGSREILINA